MSSASRTVVLLFLLVVPIADQLAVARAGLARATTRQRGPWN